MDFAKKQLEKYGWQEGKGLGKSENGITTAIKPKLKFDNAGVGHDSSEQFTNNWWEKLYNNATTNINVTKAANGNVQVNISDPDGVEITTKNYSVKNMKKNSSGSSLEYGTFYKTSKLTANGIVDLDNNYCDVVPTFSNTKTNFSSLTDDELFAACGGRTAHKGARHGLNLNGKLSRLEKQEKLLLKRLRKVSLSDETETKDCKDNLEKKLRKISDHKDKHNCESMDEGVGGDIPIGNQISVGFTSPHKNSKSRKKERKRVSFSEVVTEYQTQEVDSNAADNLAQDTDPGSLSDGNSRPPTPITTVRKVEVNDKAINIDTANVDPDEGIESDSTLSQLHAKIKEDNYKMKRKLRKLRKKYAAAESSKKHSKNSNSIDEQMLHNAAENLMKCVKRKIILEDDFVDRDSKKRWLSDDNEREFNCYSSRLEPKTKKERKRQAKKQRRLEKRINRVANSLNGFKISDIESE